MPSTAMKVSKTWVSAGTLQLQVVVVRAAKKLCAWQAALSPPGIRWLIGSQNTEKP